MASSSFALSRTGQGQEKAGGFNTIRHEVLNALTPVVAYAKDLAKGEEDPRKKEQLLAIERAGLSIERLMRAVERGKEVFEPNFKVVKVGVLLQEAFHEASALAKQKGVTIRVSHDSSSAGHVIADPGLIRRLLVNLLFNAIEVSDSQKTVVLNARQVPEGVRMSVVDQGPGFEHGDMDAMPDGFSSKGQGHGTGLSVCKTIAMLHGAILRSRNLDPGAEVFFILPQLSSRPDRRVDSKKPRLLVVDNDPSVADSISNLLSQKFSVDLAYDSHAALEILSSVEVDSMVIDMDLGHTTGMDFIREMDRWDIRRPGKIVFMTGNPAASDGDFVEGIPVLTKPFDSECLLRILEQKPTRFSWFSDLGAQTVSVPCAACA